MDRTSPSGLAQQPAGGQVGSFSPSITVVLAGVANVVLNGLVLHSNVLKLPSYRCSPRAAGLPTFYTDLS
jgi:hypothetical protein